MEKYQNFIESPKPQQLNENEQQKIECNQSSSEDSIMRSSTICDLDETAPSNQLI